MKWQGSFGFKPAGKGSACFDVSPAMVEVWQLRAHTYNLQIHDAAARLGAVGFGGGHQTGTETRLLELRIDRQ
jgi:hypothetical protein